MLYLIAAVVGYLIGSISFAWLICRSKGVDIFTVGSGNPGATNVTRALGGRWGKLCFVLDFGKGLLAAGWPWFVGGLSEPQVCAWPYGPGCAVWSSLGSAHLLSVIGMAAAIIGHACSLHLRVLTGRFRGGKAVATTMGALLALSWEVLLAGLLVWVVVYFSLGRIVGLASVVFAALLPVFACVFGEAMVVIWALVFLGGFVIYKHRSNIARLLRGEENAFSTALPVTSSGVENATRNAPESGVPKE